MGYGDSAINFTLFAWPDHFHHWLQVKSDLTAAVYEAVSAAGMSFPLPQREVRILHETEVPQVRETLPHAAGGGSPRGKEAM
jgi:potassium efflux system protein